MPHQRWYAAKGHRPVPAGIELARLPGDRVILALVTDDAGGQRRIYQVPFSWEERELADGDIGRSGPHAVVDAADHPDLVRWLTDDDEAGEFRRLAGEQSNTSIIGTTSAGPTIVKIFRVLEGGLNPDVELGRALAERGCTAVPSLRTFRESTWHRGGEEESGVLAVAHEFIDDGEDAWRTATSAAAQGRDLDAAGLGEATARVHRDLAEALGTVPATETAKDATLAVWERRVDEAIEAVPELGERREEISRLYAKAREAEWPDLQRIHGDLHLGQVMASPSRGWLLLDFEGEPLRPLAERREPDLALRDVAGMLRSFAYAAHESEARQWAEDASNAFIEGYSRHAEDPREHEVLLAALLLDKALYEARYEATNRPEWLPLPLAGIADLLGF